NWNSLSGQFGYTAVANAFGSAKVPGVVPYVQPAPATLPAALSQPPAYQAQSTPSADSRSPMVGAVCAGSCRAAGVPGWKGWNAGWMVFTAKSPQTVPGGGVGAPAGTAQEPSGFAAWVSAPSRSPLVGCSGVLPGLASAPTSECRSFGPPTTAFGQVGVAAAASHWWLR